MGKRVSICQRVMSACVPSDRLTNTPSPPNRSTLSILTTSVGISTPKIFRCGFIRGGKNQFGHYPVDRIFVSQTCGMSGMSGNSSMHPTPANQSYLTIAEVAAILRISDETVIRRFAGREGVIDLGTAEAMHRRRKRLLRIPMSALQRFIAERSAKAQ